MLAVCILFEALYSQLHNGHMSNIILFGLSEVKVVRALFDYEPQTDEDLAFKKGDRMVLIGDWYVVLLEMRIVSHIHRDTVYLIFCFLYWVHN